MESPTSKEQRLAELGRQSVARAVADTYAPLGLRERLEADRARLGPTRRRRALIAPAGAVALLVAVIALGLVAGAGRDGTIGGGRAGGPTVLALVQAGARPAIAAAPREDPSRPGFLKAAVDDVAFPSYASRLKWRSAGTRTDRVSGAPARTVYYERPGGDRVAYTIVAGTRLPGLDGARVVRDHGVDYRVARAGGRVVVAWEVKGHTCVLSAPASVGADALLPLAWWQA
jgi:hypothetical protein